MPPKISELFGHDSDEDEQAPSAPKAAGRPAAAEAGGLLPLEVREAAEKLSAFVAANGRKYEDLTRERNSRDSPLGAAYQHYAAALAAHEARQAGAAAAHDPPAGPSGQPFAGSGSAPLPPSRPDAKRSRWDHAGAPAAVPAAVPFGGHGRGAPGSGGGVPGRGGGGGLAGGRGGGGAGPGPGPGSGSTLSAMEAYMQKLASKDAAAARGGDSDEERRRRAEPLLKETSFDRRKVVAVYTTDGRRGHHMQDFLPPEELAKFLAPEEKSAAAAAGIMPAPQEPGGGLGADNKGQQLLAKMGWKPGQAIGGSGGKAAAAPAAPAAPPSGGGGGGGGLGLGALPHGAVEEDDDEFTRYRKRMQTAYKYRPNPLGNPRKPYY